MKILLFADLHMCPRASIINKWGVKYPRRLENCVASVNWLEDLAKSHECDYIINLGDFFDKPDLSSETITACKEINWSNIMHYSLVGNHDASSSSLIFNSVNSFIGNNHVIVSEPTVLTLANCHICLLPYTVECNRKPLNEYFGDLDPNLPKVILSHNDIKGIQLGPVVSKTGFEIEDIEANCDLWINGHLHNGQAISSKVINLGNLTGKDFGEDAFKHNHSVAILDTTTLDITFIENPHAFNFYKINIDSLDDLAIFERLKENSVLSIKCDSLLLDKVKLAVSECPTVVESRIIIVKKLEDTNDTPTDLDLSVDHLARFIECCKANIEDTALLEEELNEICK
jgi:DNA repair exonuclease SbcCD nuclease subunit